MRRDFSRLQNTTFDVVIVGGGVYGAFAAREAAHRGLTAAVIDAGDFGSATSANSLRTVHGGLRYLQQLDFSRMRQSIRERRYLMRLAGPLIEPMAFVMPTHGHGMRGPEAFRLALLLNDLISCDRNSGLLGQARLPGGSVLGRREAQRLLGSAGRPSFNGAALWYDAFNHSPERLVVRVVNSAVRLGAVAVNHARATRLLMRDGRIEGVAVQDELGLEQCDVKCRAVLNAAGPWVDRLLPDVGADQQLFRPSRAMNIVVPRIPFSSAVGLPVPALDRADSPQTFFVLPWGEYSLIGTKHMHCAAGQPEEAVLEQELMGFLDELNPLLGEHCVARDKVIAVLSGQLPINDSARPAHVSIAKQPRIVVHEVGGRPVGVVSVVGVKWTTARLVAAKAVQQVLALVGRPADATLPADPWAGDEASPGPAVSKSILGEHQRQRYSAELDALAAIVAGKPLLARQVVTDSPVIGAQVVLAARSEMAATLADVVLRRTELWLSRALAVDTLTQCALLMATELDWTADTVARQVADAVRALDARRFIGPAQPGQFGHA